MMTDEPWAPRIVLAPDSFKGSLTQLEVARHLAAGLRACWPAARIVSLPLSDGGEGWVATLVAASGGERRSATVTGPDGQSLTAEYGLLDPPDGRTAVIEVAAASGLAHAVASSAGVRAATSFGSGELIAHALDAGARRIVVGLGGSATNDGGAGLIRALGARLLARDGAELPHGGAALAQLATVDLSGLDPRLADVELVAACDVRNVLLGPAGASAVYGPQKGASPADVALLDAALGHFADCVEQGAGVAARDVPGAGAAGGIAFALLALCGATLRSGIELALDLVDFDAHVRDADLVLSGEGRIDEQTLEGKALAGVARRAALAGVPVFAIAGSLGPALAWEPFAALGIAGLTGTLEQPCSLAEALEPHAAGARLERAAERLARLLDAGRALARAGARPPA